MNEKKHRYNIILDARTRRKLENNSRRLGISMSAYISMLINKAKS